MIPECEDFCTWVCVVVDDIWEQIASFFKRPGPAPVCSDSELIAMALIGECRGWHMETELLSCWKEYRAMFHHIPSQSRFNRRRRNLMQAFNLIRQGILRSLDLRMDRQCSIDSLPTVAEREYYPRLSSLCTSTAQDTAHFVPTSCGQARRPVAGNRSRRPGPIYDPDFWPDHTGQ